jgi:NAD(P)-dependent dehydrogenase (short-subunit alcohol dehydrogenase family)
VAGIYTHSYLVRVMRQLEETVDFVAGAVIVTGAASGMGAATSRLLVEQGATVIMADIQDERGKALAADLGDQVTYQHADVTREDDVAALVDLAVERGGSLGGMFNNAGIIGATGPIDLIPVEEWDFTQTMLLRSVFLGVKHAARVMKPAQRGAIVNTSSIAAFRGGIGPHPYAAAKAGVAALTQNAAAELGYYGIRVNAIAPGRIATPMVAQTWVGDSTDLDGAYQAILSQSPLRDRAGRAIDIAEAAVWLLSEQSGYISGQTIVVDGGMLAGSPPAAAPLSNAYSERGVFLRQAGQRGLPAT